MDVLIVAGIGFFLSLYALYVKRSLGRRKYKPICDIHARVSCSKALGSEYSSLLFLPNSIYGLVFYALVMVFWSVGLRELVFFLSVLALLGSLYLAYVSWYKLRTLCPVCTGIYVVNLVLVLSSLAYLF